MQFDFEKGEVLLFDKPLEWSSFDLVQKVRNIARKQVGKKLKVGHAGTLDPLATGLMILCTGKCTKTIDTLQAQEKEYIAELQLGATTPSYDLETEIDATFPFDHITKEQIEAILPNFRGEIMQVPPVFSAMNVNGKRAYEYARKGQELELKARPISIFELEILDFSLPKITLKIRCSKGTYIRSLVHDIGKAVNNGAHMTALRRTKSGDFDVQNAFTIEQFAELVTANLLSTCKTTN